ncbi:ATP-dependent DNA helicase PIF1 [Paramuricea clavata]|uniref:ATP-dependent DNA helicase n=1 Tax=Paramuricea clavata TaxID=317549 RepID=A0A7D9HW69_PARCT|nr:ATP-dependent DNA helicase PIF1 [Paramuricea clavata]
MSDSEIELTNEQLDILKFAESGYNMCIFGKGGIASHNTLPFGGIQVVLVGDFWQLKPIPSPLNTGIPIYESKLFKDVFPQQFELTRILRQEESEHRLIEALRRLANGVMRR